MKSYKGRYVDYSKPVEIYRCLNRKGKIFTVRQKGKVVAHIDNIILKNCEFIVNEKGKVRCITTNQRNVHAYIKGFIGNCDDIPLSFGFLVDYDPFLKTKFYSKLYNFEFKKAKAIHIKDGCVYAYS